MFLVTDNLKLGFRLVPDSGNSGGSRRNSRRAQDWRKERPRSEFRVIVDNLSSRASWQDLKDHMRDAGDVCYSDVFKDGSGVVEYLRREDMKYALKKLDDTKFKSHEVRQGRWV